MESWQEKLQVDISDQLPILSREDVQTLLQKVLEVVESIDDLPHVEPSDLQPTLKKATAKRFVSYLQTKYGDPGEAKKEVEVHPSCDVKRSAEPTENKPTVPTKPPITYPKIPPKPKSSLSSPLGSPRALRSARTHHTCNPNSNDETPISSVFAYASGELVITPQSAKVSENNAYEANNQDVNTHRDNDVEGNKSTPVALQMTSTRVPDDISPTQSCMNYPKVPPKVLPKQKANVQASDSHHNNDVKSNEITPVTLETASNESQDDVGPTKPPVNYPKTPKRKANMQEFESHHSTDVESNEITPVTLETTSSELPNDVGPTHPPVTNPKTPPKVPPKPKPNIKDFDSNQDNFIKSNKKEQDAPSMVDAVVDVAASIETKHNLMTNYGQESSIMMQGQIKDSSAVYAGYLRERSASSPTSPAHSMKGGFMRPCVPPPSPPSKQGSDCDLESSPAAKQNNRETIKPSPDDITLEMDKRKLELDQGKTESQVSVQIEGTVKQKKFMLRSNDALEEVVTSGESAKPLDYIKSLSSEHLISKDKLFGKLRSSSDAFERSSIEPEKGQKIKKGSVFDKLRQFTFHLLSSEKADADVEKNDQPRLVGKRAEDEPMNATRKITSEKSDIEEGINTTENLLENSVYEECHSSLTKKIPESENELHDDIVISLTEKSSFDGNEISTTRSLPDLLVLDEYDSSSSLTTAWSENVLHGDYTNLSQIQKLARHSYENVLAVSHSLSQESVDKPGLTTNINEKCQEQLKVVVTKQTNYNNEEEMIQTSKNLEELDSDFDGFDSDEFDSDEFADDIGEDTKMDQSPPAEKQAIKAGKRKQIATELLTTERAYVKRLHLIDQVFYFEALNSNGSHHMFPDDVIQQMFSNIKSIYQFHNDFLLPQLEKRMADWDNTPKIGDLMSERTAPFLKLYSEYVKNFAHAIRTINKWQQRSVKFAELLADFQKKPECGRLTLQDHMLEPVQRVPRYELLLKDYLRHLDENSEDRPDTEKALELVTSTTTQANQAMVKPEKLQELLELNPMFGGAVDLTDRPRELMMEGHIFKVSARNGALFARYIFLFTDMLLVCTGHRMQGSFHLHNVLKVDTMQVLEGDNPERPFTFYVVTNSKTVELHSRTEEEKLKWFSAIEAVVREYKERHMLQQTTDAEARLGHCAPRWVKDQRTTECMLCDATFSIIKRRHHCRCCGIVVCAECSSRKAPLAYQDNKPDRVCDNCYKTLKLQNDTETTKLQHQAMLDSVDGSIA